MNHVLSILDNHLQSVTSQDLHMIKLGCYILTIASIISIMVSYYKYKAILEKNTCDANVKSLLILEASRIARDTEDCARDITPRLDSMEEKVLKMKYDLSYLYKLCPQMNDRVITFATSDSTWPIPSLTHSDIVCVYYNLVDIIDDSIISSSMTQYIHLNVTGFPVPPTSILLPAGTRIVVTRATKIPRGVRDMENSLDITSAAKTALESCLIRSPR